MKYEKQHIGDNDISCILFIFVNFGNFIGECEQFQNPISWKSILFFCREMKCVMLGIQLIGFELI